MGKRKGEKRRLYLSAKRRKCTNLENFNRCRRTDLMPYSRNVLFEDQPNTNLPVTPSEKSINSFEISTCNTSMVDSPLKYDLTECHDRNAPESFNTIETANISVESENIFDIEVEETKRVEGETILGRRIIQLEYFLDSLKKISDHSKVYGCTFTNLEIVKENRLGLNSAITFKCNMCNCEFQVFTNELQSEEDTSTMEVNTACVEGIMSIGCGFYNLEEFLSSLEIPCMDQKTYKKYHSYASGVWEKIAMKEMEKSAEKEREIAVQKGRLDEDGIPCITVVADGCWSKRSYRNNYNALSGTAAIVGLETGQVLYLGVKNKYCAICIAVEEKKQEKKAHACFKNFTGTSTSMESSIIVEGFQKGVDMYGLKYTKLVADGDSSTYKKLIDARPYKNTTIEKIECRNHLLRNYCNKLKNTTTDTRYPLKVRKLLTHQKIMKLRTAVTCAIKHRKSGTESFLSKTSNLKKDIDNSIFHVFGSHNFCDEYYCKKDKQDQNLMELLQAAPEFYNKLKMIVGQLSQNSRSLMHDLDSNIVEQFNSKVAKFIGGKRINYSKGGSYQSRCFIASLSHNTKRPHYNFHKSIVGRSPIKIKANFELKRLMKSRRQLNYGVKRKCSQKKQKEDLDYGVFCQQPDMDTEEYEREKNNFLESLQKSDLEIKAFEKNTILQSGSSLWLEERRKMLTASNFYTVCARLPTTSCVNLVRRLLYDSRQILDHVNSLNHGRVNEEKARQQMEKQLQCTIQKCGLVIDHEFPFLGASPDGFIREDTIVEIKCPYSAFNIPVEDAIKKRKITFWRPNNSINTKHSWYYQMQGQLRITNRETCILGVWTSETEDLKIEYIKRDDNFWKLKMEKLLIRFYMDCLLPELIDPRHTRNMRIRDPAYITEAIKEKTKKEIRKKIVATK